MSIEREICDAIDIIVSKAVSDAEHGTAVLATVVECINPIVGKYKIKYQSNELIAYNNNLFTFYESNTPIYVFLKNGKLDEEMIILGPSHGSQLNAYHNVFMNIDDNTNLKEILQGKLELKKENTKIKADISFMKHYVASSELKNFKFYWFIQDETSSGDHPYGGEGWRCLNEKYNNMWRVGTSEYNVGTLTGTFKCVAAMDNFTFTQTISI